MRRKLIIDGNAVYEMDDECLRCKEEREEERLHQDTIRQKKDEKTPYVHKDE